MSRFALILTLTFTLQARATNSAACQNNLLNRAEEASDPMPEHGAYAGQMVENTSGRSLKILTPQEKAAIGADVSSIVFANFRHQGNFYVAYIPGLKVNGAGTARSAGSIIEDVRAISEHWEAKTNAALAPFESHSYLAFKFKPNQGIRLIYNQTTSTPVDKTLPSINRAVLSIEALRSAQEPNADFMPHAFVADFAIGHLFYSQIDRDKAEYADTGKVEDKLSLNFDGVRSLIPGIKDPRLAILYRAIQASDQYGRRQTYNFVINNCTNRMFDILDESVASWQGFDHTLFLSEVAKSLNGDIPPAITYVKALLATKGAEIPPSILTQLNGISPDQIVPTMIYDANQSTDAQHYQTWFPPFVRAHLLGRHLLGG